MTVFFFAASDYPMLGMSDVLSNFKFVTLYGEGSHCINPTDIIRDHNGDFCQLSNNLVSSASLKSEFLKLPESPLALFVMYNKDTIELAQELGLRFTHADTTIRDLFDHKINMARFASDLNIPMVPQVHFYAQSPPPYSEVVQKLGPKIMIQYPFGSSAQTTFLINNEKEWYSLLHKSNDIELRACQYIDCFCLCVDACVIGKDAVVGPIMSEINGHPQLTTIKHSWCGNQVINNELSEVELTQVQQHVRNIGRLMATKGFQGYYSVDLLFDKKQKRAFFSEVNPRVSGGSTVANLCMHFTGLKPLVGLHIDNYLKKYPTESLDSINWVTLKKSREHIWSQIIFKNISHSGQATQIPRRGIIDLSHPQNPLFIEKAFSIPHPNPNFIYFTPEVLTNDTIDTDSEIGSLLSVIPLYTPDTGELTDIGQKALAIVKNLIEIKPHGKNSTSN